MKKRAKKLTIPTSSKAIVKSYQKKLLKYQSDYKKFMMEELSPVISRSVKKVKGDIPELTNLDFDIGKEVQAAIDRAVKRLNSKYPDSTIKKWIKETQEKIDAGTTRDLKRSIDSSQGATLKIRMDAKKEEIDLRPNVINDRMKGFYENMKSNNLMLIKSIGTKENIAIATLLMSNLFSNKPVAEIKNLLETKINITRSRARFIASDQVQETTGKVNIKKMEAIGLKRYVWKTANDARVRGRPGGLNEKSSRNHWAREGKIFTFDNPPAGGHPGEDYRCRCYAEPIEKDII